VVPRGVVVSGLIVGLLGLVLVVGLVMFIRGRRRPRPSADDTLVTDLLGPSDRSAIPAPQAQPEPKPAPAPPAQQDGEPAPAPSALPAREDDWLETQLAWISAWSQRMNQQLTSAEQSEPDSKE